MGKRDVSHDLDLPLARQWYRPGLHARPQDLGAGFAVAGLNDQHACLRVPRDSPLRVGDLVGFGISHPCTTFDKWRLLYVVDDDYSGDRGDPHVLLSALPSRARRRRAGRSRRRSGRGRGGCGGGRDTSGRQSRGTSS